MSLARRNRKGEVELECGCVHTDIEWVRLCDLHGTEVRKDAARWAANHIQHNHGTTFTPEYRALAAEYTGPATLAPTTVRYHGQAKAINEDLK